MEIVCSQCRKPFVQAVRRQGVLDRLLHWAYIHPYGCQICRHRFYVMQWGLRPPEAPMDGGQYRMRPVRVHAMLTDEQGEHEGMMTDLSASGCIIETRTSLLEGALLGIPGWMRWTMNRPSSWKRRSCGLPSARGLKWNSCGWPNRKMRD